jgi:hypothetical protein
MAEHALVLLRQRAALRHAGGIRGSCSGRRRHGRQGGAGLRAGR